MDNEQIEELLIFISDQQQLAQSEREHDTLQKVYNKIIELAD